MNFNFKSVYYFAILSLFTYLNCRTSTKGMIKEIGINERFYPKRYVVPCNFIAKHFRIGKKKIPRFLYIRLYVAIVYAMMFLFNTVLYCILYSYEGITGVLIFYHCIFVLLDTVCFLLLSLVYKYR